MKWTYYAFEHPAFNKEAVKGRWAAHLTQPNSRWRTHQIIKVIHYGNIFGLSFHQTLHCWEETLFCFSAKKAFKSPSTVIQSPASERRGADHTQPQLLAGALPPRCTEMGISPLPQSDHKCYSILTSHSYGWKTWRLTMINYHAAVGRTAETPARKESNVNRPMTKSLELFGHMGPFTVALIPLMQEAALTSLTRASFIWGLEQTLTVRVA